MQGFQSKIAETVTDDFRHFKLIKEIAYIALDGTLYIMPVGASSDLISSPAATWPVRPPFGKDALSGYLHDCGYQNTLLIQKSDGTRLLANLTKEQCDDLIREAALSLGDNAFEADQLYYGVKEFGWRPFRDDRSSTVNT